jgi:hypothetical protein
MPDVQNMIAHGLGQQQVQVPMVMHSDKIELKPVEGYVLQVRLKQDEGRSDVCSECLERIPEKINAYYCEKLMIAASGHFVPTNPFILSVEVTEHGRRKFRTSIADDVVLHPGDSDAVDCVGQAPLEEWMKNSAGQGEEAK